MAAAAAAVVIVVGVFVVTLPDNDRTLNEVANSHDAVVTTLDPPVEGQSGNVRIGWSDDLDQVVIVGSGFDNINTTG